MPNEKGLRRIWLLKLHMATRDVFGSWNCQNWNWNNCPISQAGQFKGKEKYPTVVLEDISDGEQLIWAQILLFLVVETTKTFQTLPELWKRIFEEI